MFGAPRSSLRKCIRLVDDVRAAVVTLPLAQVHRRYCPSWLFIIASIFSLMAVRLKEAACCIGG
jgi:hypothetical protein